MGTVGLSFGSATSGTGFDVATTVTSILAIQQGVETPWKNELTKLQAQDTVFSTLGTDLSTLSTKLGALTQFDGVMYEKEGSSSNTNALTLTSASTTAIAGSHEVTVSQLAQTSSVYTGSVGSKDTLSGSISIQVGSGDAQTITVDSSSNTLSTLAAAINTANIGVTASIITDTTGSRLSIVSATSGSGGQLTISNALNDDTTSSAITTQTGQTGQDAKLTVDGISVTNASNTVSSAIPGVSFQLLALSSAPIQVQITTDTADISSAVNDFVTAYNQLDTDMKNQEGNDSSGNPEPLYGDRTLALMQTALGQALNGGAASGSMTNISQLGITVNEDGSLSFSQSDLIDSLSSNFNDVVGYLQNTGSFGQNFTSVINSLSSTSSQGALYLAKTQNSTTETSLNKNISDQEARIATQKTTLTAQLNEANQILQAIPSQLNEVDEMYSAVTGYKSSN